MLRFSEPASPHVESRQLMKISRAFVRAVQGGKLEGPIAQLPRLVNLLAATVIVMRVIMRAARWHGGQTPVHFRNVASEAVTICASRPHRPHADWLWRSSQRRRSKQARNIGCRELWGYWWRRRQRRWRDRRNHAGRRRRAGRRNHA